MPWCPNGICEVSDPAVSSIRKEPHTSLRSHISRSLATDEPVAYSVRPYPEPHHDASVFYGKSTVMQAAASGPKATQLLEMQERMLRSSLQQLVGFVSQALYVVRKLPITSPKPRLGVARPGVPPRRHLLFWRSHATASNSANHVLNASRSAGVSRRTASSISLTLLITLNLLEAATSHN